MISSAWRLRGGQLGAALLLLILLGCALQAAASDLQAVEVVWRLVLDHGGELVSLQCGFLSALVWPSLLPLQPDPMHHNET